MEVHWILHWYSTGGRLDGRQVGSQLVVDCNTIPSFVGSQPIIFMDL
jgi:hypothetical protein